MDPNAVELEGSSNSSSTAAMTTHNKMTTLRKRSSSTTEVVHSVDSRSLFDESMPEQKEEIVTTTRVEKVSKNAMRASALAHRKNKKSPLSSDAIFHQTHRLGSSAEEQAALSHSKEQSPNPNFLLQRSHLHIVRLCRDEEDEDGHEVGKEDARAWRRRNSLSRGTHLFGGNFFMQFVTMMEGPQMQQQHNFLRAPPAPPATTVPAAAPAEFGCPNVIFDEELCCGAGGSRLCKSGSCDEEQGLLALWKQMRKLVH